ncbi:MAG: preprotein translocase subunit YajC [Clostridia bacterium]|nr:preprotein translocase subunit YajC [Clostridia bacterium]
MEPNTIMTVAYLVVIFVVFYFFLIRPQKKREKQTKEMINAIKVGDDVLTIGGIRGTVARIKDDRIFIESSKQEKTVIEIEKWAIKDVLKYVEDK